MYVNLPFAVLIVYVGLVSSQSSSKTLNFYSGSSFNSLGLIKSKGYLGETHRVTTKDGYILVVHRLRSPCGIENRPRPTIIHHGLFSSSETFLDSPSGGGYAYEAEYANETNVGNIIAFELGMRCFDVWLPNSRGNKYSREHSRLREDKSAFWDFSYDEMIAYDLPAVIDYILEETEHEKLDYVGHSQGTLIMFGLLSSRKDYDDKINKFIALAPIARAKHMTSSFKHFSKVYTSLRWINKIKSSRIAEMYIKSVEQLFCKVPKLKFQVFCLTLKFYKSDYYKNLEINRLGVYLIEYPTGTSFKNMAHWFQAIQSGDFKRYDYGNKNIEVYHQSTPPKYDLGKITHPNIYLISAQGDEFATLENVNFIRRELGRKPKGDYFIPDQQFGHSDFMISPRSGELVNQKIYNILTDKTYF